MSRDSWKRLDCFINSTVEVRTTSFPCLSFYKSSPLAPLFPNLYLFSSRAASIKIADHTLIRVLDLVPFVSIPQPNSNSPVYHELILKLFLLFYLFILELACLFEPRQRWGLSPSRPRFGPFLSLPCQENDLTLTSQK
jgi:hypothetical protein